MRDSWVVTRLTPVVLVLAAAAALTPAIVGAVPSTEVDSTTTAAAVTTPTRPYTLDQVDPADFVRFTPDVGAGERRAQLIETIWGDSGPPTEPGKIELSGPSERRGFAIVHHGHVPVDISAAVEALHGLGYATVEIQMPGVDGDRSSSAHNNMFQEMGGAAMPLFLNPSIEALNAFDAIDPDLPVAMIGLSGGGWTTHMVAAVDERVDVSIPVAGSLPLFARPFSPGSHGDAEQVYAPIFGEVDSDGDEVPDTATGSASWLEVYALATTSGRRQVQVINLHDPCCFGGTAHESYSSWMRSSFSGWSVFVDSNTELHAIGETTINEVIVAALR